MARNDVDGLLVMRLHGRSESILRPGLVMSLARCRRTPIITPRLPPVVTPSAARGPSSGVGPADNRYLETTIQAHGLSRLGVIGFPPVGQPLDERELRG